MPASNSATPDARGVARRVVEALDPLDRLPPPAQELVPLGGVALHELADPAGRELHVRELVGLEVVGQLGDPVVSAPGRVATDAGGRRLNDTSRDLRIVS